MKNKYMICSFFVCQTQERKELLKGSYRERHFNAGSVLLGFGVFEAVFGGVNTWFRTGKLFPGPHLFAGAGKSFALQCSGVENVGLWIWKLILVLYYLDSHYNALGRRCGSCSCNAERERDG